MTPEQAAYLERNMNVTIRKCGHRWYYTKKPYGTHYRAANMLDAITKAMTHGKES